jgi:hypothetical protein
MLYMLVQGMVGVIGGASLGAALEYLKGGNPDPIFCVLTLLE